MSSSICIGAVAGGILIGGMSTPMPVALFSHVGLPVLKASTLIESIGFGLIGAVAGMIVAFILIKIFQKKNHALENGSDKIA